MSLTKEDIEKWDDYKLQDGFATAIVLYGMFYNEMEKRDLLVNPKK